MFSFIIVNYNGGEYIERCIESLLRLKVEKEIIVVDNGSKDDSCERIKKYPVSLFKMEKNEGYPKGINYGIKNSKGEFIFLLTPTTFIISGNIEELKRYDVCGIKLYDEKGNIVRSVRKIPSILDFLFLLTGISEVFKGNKILNRWREPHFDYEKKGLAEQPMSCALFLKRDVIERVGYFDERFFLYFSDVDLSKNLKENGIKTYYIPDISGIHLRGGITYKIGLKRLEYFYKDMMRYIYKHYKLFANLFILPLITNYILRRFFKN
uniref:Glycosyltransferase n=1 Tax=candidate division WOR-3 bacterium TaxID=2052148 RepID=A0A7C4YGE1_UNCW3